MSNRSYIFTVDNYEGDNITATVLTDASIEVKAAGPGHINQGLINNQYI